MKTVEVRQGSEEWFAARRGIPTASRFDMVITPEKGVRSASQEKLIDTLIAESLGLLENAPVVHTADMERGIIEEAQSRCAFDLEHGNGKVTEVGFVLHDSGLFGGSPDALVGDDGGVEIKSPGPVVQLSYLRAAVLPSCYKAQLHGYMIVTGRPWWAFYSRARGLPPFHLVIKRDDFTKKLEDELHAFCQRYNAARVAMGLKPIGQ